MVLCLLSFGVGFGFRCCGVIVSFCAPGFGLTVLRDGFASFGDGGRACFLVELARGPGVHIVGIRGTGGIW
jgi:hypothetical protein